LTVLGLDVSDNQATLDLNAAFDQGYEFATARCVIGNYCDKRYATFRDVAKARGKLFAAYVFPHTDIPWSTHAALTREWIGDPSIPIMLDTEPDPPHGSRPPTLADCVALTAALRAEGLRVVSFYSYDYFERTLGAVRSLGLALVMANYVSGRGYGSALYPGDTAGEWGPYVEGPVSLLQYSSSGVIDGYAGTVDLDAWRGTLAQLIASGLFTDWSDVATDLTPAAVAAVATAVHGFGYINPETKVNQSFETRIFEVAAAIATHADTGRPSVKTELAALQTELDTVKATVVALQGSVAGFTGKLATAVDDLDTRLAAILAAVQAVQGPPGLPGPAGPQGPAGTPAVVDAAAVEAVLAGTHAEVTFATPAAAQ
jgi:hypothetical protein